MFVSSADYFADACYQALAYWIMSAMTNDPFVLARYAGLYKALQSAGSAGSFGMDAVATPYLNEHLASWLMMLFSEAVNGVWYSGDRLSMRLRRSSCLTMLRVV